MKNYEFKTNIMCDSCIAKVSPVFNESFGDGNWKVDIKDPKKILTVSTDENITNVINAIEKTGYKAEQMHKLA
jgi:copper chaperone